MLTAAKRPEHIIAAAWASQYLRERGVAVVHVQAAGVRFEQPELAAAELCRTWLAEPRKEHLLTKLYKPLSRLHDWVVKWWKGDRPETLALPPPRTTWLPENIRDSVKLEVAIADGRRTVVNVPFIRRAETMSLIGMSSAFTVGAAVIPIPAVGNLFLIPGVITAALRAAFGYGKGDVAAGNAALLTGVKLALFCAADCVPVVANATFTATLARTRSAFEHYRAGEDLIDTEKAEKELEALTGSRQPLLTHAVETPVDHRLRDPDGHLSPVVADRDVVRP
ncbi:MAG: hypothetical protein ACAI38_23380 [Myxococcota bacterium]|nr:hypothetical protein [Myxococcota bacterium]